MKKFALIFLLAPFLHSCLAPKAVQIVSLDLAIYNEEGMFITQSNSVNFEYDPISVVQVDVTEGLNDKSSTQETLDILVEEAREAGANAIINLETKVIYSKDSKHIVVMGMAVRKK